MIIFEQRAATVLFNLVRSHPVDGPFLLPANICPIVPMVFHKARRPFEFVDIAPDTLCMDRDAVVKRWSSPGNVPAGLVYVRTYGAVFDASDLFSCVKALSPNALIVDDRCLCPPEFSGTLPQDTDAVLYSTGYAKYADIGFGGFGVIDNGIPYIRAVSTYSQHALDELTQHYKDALREHARFSYTDSAWLDTSSPQEDWAAYQERVEQTRVRAAELKAEMNSIYSSRLPPQIQLPSDFQGWRFNIQVQDKAAVLDAIRREGLFASGHYDSLAGRFGPGKAPVAERLHRHVINLFNDRYFSPEQAISLSDLSLNFKPISPGPQIS